MKANSQLRLESFSMNVQHSRGFSNTPQRLAGGVCAAKMVPEMAADTGRPRR